MTCYTLSTGEGQSISASSSRAISTAARAFIGGNRAPAARLRDVELLGDALEFGRVGEAGELANRLGLNFAWSASRASSC